jgi:hypothetical protein
MWNAGKQTALECASLLAPPLLWAGLSSPAIVCRSGKVRGAGKPRPHQKFGAVSKDWKVERQVFPSLGKLNRDFFQALEKTVFPVSNAWKS